jgi:DNA polymerase III epsilon subunit-like protein
MKNNENEKCSSPVIQKLKDTLRKSLEEANKRILTTNILETEEHFGLQCSVRTAEDETIIQEYGDEKIEEKGMENVMNDMSQLKIDFEMPIQPMTRGRTLLAPKSFSFPADLTNEEVDLIKSRLPSNKIFFLDTETTGVSKKDRIIEIAIVCRDYERMEETYFYSLMNPDGIKSCREAYNAHKISYNLVRHEQSFGEVWRKGISPFLFGEKELGEVEEVDSIEESKQDQSLKITKLEQINSKEDHFNNNNHTTLGTPSNDYFTSYPIIVAHNASFDCRMLNQELARIQSCQFPKGFWRCTYELARSLYGQAKGRNTLDNLCIKFAIDTTERINCHSAMVDTLLLADVYVYLLLETA